MPRKLRELISDLEKAGFQLVKGGKGSHRKFRHYEMASHVLLSGKDGADALPYQEKHVKRAIESIRKP